MENFFKLKEHGTDVRTEIIAGATTFLSMLYILAVTRVSFLLPEWTVPLFSQQQQSPQHSLHSAWHSLPTTLLLLLPEWD